jgi:hypothetical protein
MEIAPTLRAPSGGALAPRGAAPAPLGEFIEALRANFADAPAADAASARGARFRGVTKHKRTQRFEVRTLTTPPRALPIAAARRRPRASFSPRNLAHPRRNFRSPAFELSSALPPAAVARLRAQAHIWQAKKQIYLGGFASEVLAARSHDLMALRCRGSAAAADVLNFPPAAYAALAPLLSRLPSDDVVAALRSFSKAQTAARAVGSGASATPGARGVAKLRAPWRPALAPRCRRPACASGNGGPSGGGSEASDTEDEWARGLAACSAVRTEPRGSPCAGGGQGLCSPRFTPTGLPATPAPWGALPALLPPRGFPEPHGAGFGSLARSLCAPQLPALAALDAFDLEEALAQLVEEPVRRRNFALGSPSCTVASSI